MWRNIIKLAKNKKKFRFYIIVYRYRFDTPYINLEISDLLNIPHEMDLVS